MEYKESDTIRLLKDIAVPDTSIILKKNREGTVCSINENNIFLDIVQGSVRANLTVNINDIEFVERRTERAEECPICNSWNIDHETVVNNGERFYYPWSCVDCGASGKEWYSMSFVETVCDDINDK